MSHDPVAARVRRLERHGAASLRALAAEPDAEYRANRLRVHGKPQPYAAPYLAASFDQIPLGRARGVVDSLALRCRHSHAKLHAELLPDDTVSRLVFDVIEQMRCESLYAEGFPGVRKNLDDAFIDWCSEVHASGMAEGGFGLLLYTVVHMVRARLIGTVEDESAEALIESVRGNLAPTLGHSLYRLPKVRENQRAYAEPALQIALAISEEVGDQIDVKEESRALRERFAIPLPPDWQESDADEAPADSGHGVGGMSSEAEEISIEQLGDYRIFTTEYDKEVDAHELLRADRRLKHRGRLDRLMQAQAVSVPQLAQALKGLFANPVRDGWLFNQDEGRVDARRLAQLVSQSSVQSVFQQERLQLASDAAITFLVDNSGSMKRQRFAAVAVLLDTFCRALDLAGIASEVLGFTTADWNGGRAMNDWRKAGAKEGPGRLGETLHVVYKDADTPWRRARGSLATLLDTQHYREGVDGEALIWAYQRLQARSEAEKYLVVISDGAPMDAATQNTNREGFLADHLSEVTRFIDQRSSVHLGSIGIDLDMGDMYANAVSLDLGGTLGHASYRVLHTLFAESAVVRRHAET